MRTALVFCGGGPSHVEIAVPDDPLVIAADVGAVEALRLGYAVELLVGDMDSVPAAVIHDVESAGGQIQRHPVDKDATDLDLALRAALARGVDRALIVGGGDGRLDHLLGNAIVMSAPRYGPIQMDAIFGRAQLHVIRGDRDLEGTPGETLSLFAMGGTARGVRSTGVRWPLAGAVLEPGASLGISNEFTEPVARLGVDEGVVLVIRPGRHLVDGQAGP
ncbi:MAG TPA: thiamine diphosphokinase [Actinomycetota bacterium]